LWPVVAVVMPEPLVVTMPALLEPLTAQMALPVLERVDKFFGQPVEPIPR
jgi:hypothetical protein